MTSNMPNLIWPSQRSSDIILYFPFFTPVHTISCLHTLALKTIPLSNLSGQYNSFLFIGGSRVPEALSVTCHYIIISPYMVKALAQAVWDMQLRLILFAGVSRAANTITNCTPLEWSTFAIMKIRFYIYIYIHIKNKMSCCIRMIHSYIFQ